MRRSVVRIQFYRPADQLHRRSRIAFLQFNHPEEVQCVEVVWHLLENVAI